MDEGPIWGVSAEFDTADAMVAAIRRLRPLGFGRLDAFTPYPVPELGEALRLRAQPTAPFAVAGAILGGLGMMGMCAYATVSAYPFDIGGRPLFSWPAYVVPSVSAAMMTGALAVTGALLVLNRLPRLNHPAFNIPDFTRASADRFFLAVEAADGFDPVAVEDALAALAVRPRRVSRVPR